MTIATSDTQRTTARTVTSHGDYFRPREVTFEVAVKIILLELSSQYRKYTLKVNLNI